MLRKIIDFHYKLLEKYPKLAPLKPLIDAGDNFFYGVSDVTEKKPHIRDGIDIKRFMITALFGVLPAALGSIYLYGHRAILIILTSYIIGGLAEVLFCIIRKEEITEGFLITGMIYPLILPPTLPLWMVALGIVVGVILGKEVFGGTGRNPFNAALVSRCFIYVCFPMFMTSTAFVDPLNNSFTTSNWKPIIKGWGGFVKNRGLISHHIIDGRYEGVTSATPLAKLKVLRLKAEDNKKDSYKDYINYIKSSIPKLFWGNYSGCLGETSAFLIILGGLYLLLKRIANWRTVISTLIAGALWSYLLYEGKCFEDKIYIVIFSLLSGGFLFGTMFMATDPVTGPGTNLGRYFYGFMIGTIAIIIRRFSGYPEGIMFAILLMNIFAPLIDEIILLIRFREERK